jgi:hypothetical protein
VFLVVLFQPSSSAAVAYQESITHIHTFHHWIVVKNYFGLLDVLASNPSLDQVLSWVGLIRQISFLSFHIMIIICPCRLLHFLLFFFQFFLSLSVTPFPLWCSVSTVSVCLLHILLDKWGLEN